jgi:hypothetical protein
VDAEEEEEEEEEEVELAIMLSVVIHCNVGQGTPPVKDAASVAIFVAWLYKADVKATLAPQLWHIVANMPTSLFRREGSGGNVGTAMTPELNLMACWLVMYIFVSCTNVVKKRKMIDEAVVERNNVTCS